MYEKMAELFFSIWLGLVVLGVIGTALYVGVIEPIYDWYKGRNGKADG